MPRPGYARLGRVAILCPSTGSLAEVDRWLAVAHGRRTGRGSTASHGS